MCGIAGMVSRAPLPESEAAVKRMIRAQAHRGPDDEGMTSFEAPGLGGHLVLGSRRLAVLDPSPAGHQPMGNEDGTVWVVHNGEIYNFKALRRELMQKGHRFHSNTDTEVILRAYEEYGEECVRQFRGMFAFAVWDARRQQLWLARDRFGEKPLYVHWDQGRLLFASELRALLASGLVERTLNLSAAQGYLNFGSVPAPQTIIEEVQALGPGQWLRLKDGEVRHERYWDLSFHEPPAARERDVAEALRSHLREAVRLRLVSDVPIGAFLSGGIDSSVVVALMREAGVSALRTFSLGFEDDAVNEGPFARIVAQRFETDHTEHLVTSGDVFNSLETIISAMDQPSFDGFNTYLVSQLARRSGTVVALSGLGGDEVFGGYSSFWLVPRLCRVGRLFAGIPGGRGGVRMLLGRLAQDDRSQKLRTFLRCAPSPEAAYLAVKGQLLDESCDSVLSDGVRCGNHRFDPLGYLRDAAGDHHESVFNRVCRLELRTYLHNQLLRDADAMSMAHALEVRMPFLDHVLVEFMAGVPTALKRRGTPKQLLSNVLSGLLPREVTDRPKMAFAFPFEKWMKHEWRTSLEDRWLHAGPSGSAARLLDAQGIRQLWGRFLAGQVRWSRVWAIIVLQAWIRQHVDGATSAMPVQERPYAVAVS